jgi:hypothetical protein
MKEVDDPLAGDPGEKILVTSGEANDLVREDGADDHEQVILVDKTVDRDGDVQLEQTIRDIADLRCADDADLSQRIGVLPQVIEEARVGECRPALLGRHLQAAQDHLIRHRRVGA